ncbi:MAG: CsbD family protein [Thermoleophilia bacterium]|nr:CsbD family protein [Thermoleophilia bacterium]
MTGETDDLKGRVKEAAGALTDDDDLRNEGKADQAAGSAKDKVGKAADWADDKIDQAKDKLADKN